MIVFLVATAAMCWLSYYLMLVYASSCASLQSQLEQFTFGKLDCACCAKGHASEDEHCDRKTISQCISVWFGSTEQFERAARQEVQHALQQQLGKALCPYSLHLQLEVPFLWAGLDTASARFRAGDWEEGLWLVLGGLVWFLLIIPAIYRLTISAILRLKRLLEENLGFTPGGLLWMGIVIPPSLLTLLRFHECFRAVAPAVSE
ncbi:cpr6 [Symbiodinium natans]|uniref:Cpr6 protein n=1 Tax=Symbiodinium natans TaxID=878477 RepID=A0A812IHG4_9DINO|nr:cpr6 [Symbiodinium natans]